MLGEGFLRLLPYKEERTLTSATNRQSTQNRPRDTTTEGALPNLFNDRLSVEAGCPPVLNWHPHMSSGFNTSCSLLAQYPDLRLGQETQTSDGLGDPGAPLRSTYSTYCNIPGAAQHRAPEADHGTHMSDQGYLVMGTSLTNDSMDVPGSRLEPMSNSLLNGLLDKQLGEVYLQHLTDSLARCNYQPGDSLLQGLVPPPQRNNAAQGLESLGFGGEGSVADHGKTIGYLITQNGPPCSSNFSSPVLRISEAQNYQTH